MYDPPPPPEEQPVQHNHTYSTPVEPTPHETTTSASSRDIAFMLNQQSFRRSNSRRTTETDCSESIISDDEGSVETQFSRDERRARALNIPIPTADIINLPIDEFNEKLAKYDLTEAQLSLIRDIRRRGKNKVAAQNCRKRKMDQICGLQGDVDRLYAQKEQMEQEQAQLLYLRELARDKYTKLLNFFQDSRAEYLARIAHQDPPEDPNDPSNTVTVTTSTDGEAERHMSHLTVLNSNSSSFHHHRHHGNPAAVAAGGPSNSRVLHDLEME